MITKISIRDVATFTGTATEIGDLKKINFFFGANGSGKTTISKVIAEPASYPGGKIDWKGGNALETHAYNTDFVDRNFKQQMKGVFTLGEHEADIQAQIEATKDEIGQIEAEIVNLTNTLHGEDSNGGKNRELSNHEVLFEERFWSAKLKYEEKFRDALQGSIKSKHIFKERILSEREINTADLLTIVELETKPTIIFSNEHTIAKEIQTIQSLKLLSLQHAPILTKRVVGREDVDIAAMIKKLGNSDWVRQGRTYYRANDRVCPFCQQTTDEILERSLNEYFNEAFDQDNAAINALVADYQYESARIQQQVKDIIDLNSEFVDRTRLEHEKNLLDSIIVINLQRLNQKAKEVSQTVELDSHQNVLDAIVAIIASANEKINNKNDIVGNIKNEKNTLTLQIWRFIVEELKNEIRDYNTKKSDLSAAINNLKSQMETKVREKRGKETSLRALEGQIVSIQPTLKKINDQLSSFGFHNFKLAEGNDGKTYKLIRPNGSEVLNTLSDGEKNFISFLYFFHLLKGSHTESTLNNDRVVVFDDPVSSLDSDVLFIVSTLIRSLFEDLRNNNGTIKQIFILTHNVYFHKEISFKHNNKNEVSFWLIKKRGVHSIVEYLEKNPIKTSYDLLWDEVRAEPENRNNTTFQNTLRRILETYFNLAGISLDGLHAEFIAAEEKIMYKTLCSWVNAGSHGSGLFEDLNYAIPDEDTIEKYLQVFKKVFYKLGQISHYNMMMHIDTSEE